MVLEPVLPIEKLAVYGDNLDFFGSLDALVVAEKTSLLLKTRYGLSKLCVIHTRHGAGDRAIGFNRASAEFDHVLASGRKILDRLVADAGLPASSVSSVGYPKFDIAPAAAMGMLLVYLNLTARGATAVARWAVRRGRRGD